MTEQRARPRLTIGVQLALLVLACLGAVHIIFFAMVTFLPPPRPPIYRMQEIATALNGGALAARDGRPMLRETVAELPAALARSRAPPPMVEALAEAVDRPLADVRLSREGRRRAGGLGGEIVGARVVVQHARRAPHPGGRPPREGPGPGLERFELRLPPNEGAPHHGPRGMRFLLMHESPVFGDFSAAVRRPGGGWTVVRSSAEPFPTDWQKRTFLLALAGFLVVGPAAFLFARRITAPLKQFSDAAERLGRDPRGEPVTLKGPAEIGALAEAFNNMQGRIRRYIDDRTAMVGAISHDLRTPLARIRFKLEGAPETLKTSVLGDVEQMEQMIAGVLAFIRDESTPRNREKLDLLSVVEVVADDAAMVGGDVELTAGEAVTVDGDAVALKRLFSNLVDNAVKYGAQARITVRREGEHAVVEIADTGPGLQGEDLERVFQPFYRADASRNVDAGGMGLGLPIARSTARAHGGDIILVPGARGLTARVTLPIA